MATVSRVSIVGGSLWGNRGAEAMVTTCVGYLRRRRPEVQVSVLSYLPARDRVLVRAGAVSVVDARPLTLVAVLLPFALGCWLAGKMGLRVPDALLPGAVRELRESTVLLDVFGISFADGRELFLPFNVFSLLPAFLLGVPVVKLSQAMGPFNNRLNRHAARFTLQRCARIFARGERTAHHLGQLGLPADSWDTAADLAFLHDDAFSLSQENSDRLSGLSTSLQHVRRQGRGIVAICPSSVVYRKAVARKVDYIGVLAAIVGRLLRDGRDVLVVPHATRAGLRTLRNNDLPVVGRLRERCAGTGEGPAAARVHWVDFDVNSAGIRSVLQFTDLVVTSRFHAMVAALALGVPPLVLGWSHKYQEVLRDFALEDSCFDIDNLDVDVFCARLQFMSRPEFRAGWRHEEYLVAARAAAMRQLNWVEAFLARG